MGQGKGALGGEAFVLPAEKGVKMETGRLGGWLGGPFSVGLQRPALFPVPLWGGRKRGLSGLCHRLGFPEKLRRETGGRTRLGNSSPISSSLQGSPETKPAKEEPSGRDGEESPPESGRGGRPEPQGRLRRLALAGIRHRQAFKGPLVSA